MHPPGRDGSHAKDLSRENPRSMEATIAGYPWLPRMVDKARAAHSGTLGTYYRYPCPIDRVCLKLLGLTAEAFQSLSILATDDASTLRLLADAGADLRSLRSFDPVALNRSLHPGGS